MHESDDVVEFKAFAVGMAIAILYPLTVHYAGEAFFGGSGMDNAMFMLKLFFGVAAMIGGVCLRIRTLSTAIVVGGLICFVGAVIFQWDSLTAVMRFWSFFSSLVMVCSLAYYHHKCKA